MVNKHKYTYVKAFTIVEAVVGMVVTAIIIAIIFVIFSITTERLFDFKKQNGYIADLNRLTYSVNKAIFENEVMTAKDNKLLFTSYNGEQTYFEWKEEYMVRIKGEFVDTFNLAMTKIRIDTLSEKQGKGMYQRLNWNVNNGVNLSFYKKIYANEILKTIEK